MMVTSRLFLVIGGGSFQGKSLAALHSAYRLHIPAILSTDSVRNVLRTLQPDTDWLGTSTYLLSAEDLRRQMDAVSSAVLGSLNILRKRGEKCVVEGMHLSRVALESLVASGDSLLVCLDNRSGFDRIIATKAVSRSRLNLESYRRHRERIQAIRREILQSYREVGVRVLSFDLLDDMYTQLDEFLDSNSR